MMRRVWLSGIILASFLAARAEAQVPVPGCLNATPCTAVQAFTPIATTTLAVSNASASVAFPGTGTNLNLLVTNSGTVTAYYVVGNSSVVATTANAPIDPGQTIVVPQGTWTTIAAITANSTTTLTIKSGTGQPNITYPGTAGSGGGPVTQATSPWQTSGSLALTAATHGPFAIPAATSTALTGVTGSFRIQNSPLVYSGGTLTSAANTILAAINYEGGNACTTPDVVLGPGQIDDRVTSPSSGADTPSVCTPQGAGTVLVTQ